MSLQFEDVVDCLQVLYPKYNFLFLFDHSQGHARKRKGALSAMHMALGLWRGATSHVRHGDFSGRRLSSHIHRN